MTDQPADITTASEPHGPELLETIEELKPYLVKVSELSQASSRLWFRGARKSSYHLEPSLYRHPVIKDANALIELEWSLLSDFRHRAPPFTTTLPGVDLELLFMMQHFGVPTRLLDWSESPLVALFFALENARQAGAGSDDATVWVLDPTALNALAADHREGSDQIYGAYAPELDAYAPRAEGKNLKEKLPSAMFGIHNSPRIVAQRGTFVIFGKDTRAMDENPRLLESGPIVRRINIKSAAKASIFSELSKLGMADSVVYPDLDGLGRELKNYRGF